MGIVIKEAPDGGAERERGGVDTWMLVTLCVLGGMAALALVWLVAVAAQRFALKSLEKSLRPRVERRYAAENILLASYEADFFGLESRGLGQVRGNGALILTPGELHFIQAVPGREVVIPLEGITAVSVVRSHLKKWVARDLLRVDYRTPGGPEAAAWFVYDPSGWKGALEAARAVLENGAHRG
jgi:hypothetical protein